MNLASPRQIEAFVRIAASGSVRAASEAMFLSQPAVSMALADLERQLGQPLFDRERGRLHLNDRGRDLLPLARELLERHQEFMRMATGEVLTVAGELRVGTSNTVGNYRVGELVGPFVAAHPSVSLRLTVSNTRTIADALLDHAIDVGCVEGPVSHAAILPVPWREDRLVVCARPGHRLAGRRRIRPDDLSGESWILREQGSATRALSEQALAMLSDSRTVLELDQTEAIKQAVIAGLGLACLPEVAVVDAVQTGRLCVLATPFLDLRRTLTVLVHQERYRGATLKAFLASLDGMTARP
jgi:DNA-binding transcriptional LysR family regulator